MTLEVWKFPLSPVAHPIVNMPMGARILSVGEQRGNAFVWALVDPMAPLIRHAFRLAGTGHPIAPQETANFVGTFQMASGTLVWHVFDLDEQPQ